MKKYLSLGSFGRVVASAVLAVTLIYGINSLRVWNAQRNYVPPPKENYVQHEIDVEKIKTLPEAIAILKVLLPERPMLNVRPDSVQDMKKYDSLKNLLKAPAPQRPMPFKKPGKRK